MAIYIRNQQRHRPLDKSKIAKAASNILSFLKQPKAELSILFVGNRKMLQLNSMYRGIKKTTDILSFDAQIQVTGHESNVLGDIVINIPKAESQAKEFQSDFYDELYRLMIHGALHLTGYDHECSSYRKRKMLQKEQEIFHALKKMD